MPSFHTLNYKSFQPDVLTDNDTPNMVLNVVRWYKVKVLSFSNGYRVVWQYLLSLFFIFFTYIQTLYCNLRGHTSYGTKYSLCEVLKQIPLNSFHHIQYGVLNLITIKENHNCSVYLTVLKDLLIYSSPYASTVHLHMIFQLISGWKSQTLPYTEISSSNLKKWTSIPSQ